jgi:hypothetical protein
MTHATMLLNLGTFALAIPGAVAATTDQIQKIKKSRAKNGGRVQKPSFSDNHPVWSISLTGLMVVALIAGFWMVFHRPQQPSVAAATPPTQPVMLQKKPPTTTLLPQRSAPKAPRPAAPPAQDLVPQAITAVTTPQQPVTQSGIGNSQTTQTMTNSPGGMQAGRDLYAIGKMPTPERIINPDDIKSAGDILSSGSGRIEIITFPTDVAPNSEIGKFAEKLEYALYQRGWTVYRDRETHIGSFNERIDMPYGPHGVGCATSRPPSEASSIAMKALSALKYHCAGPSVINDFENAGHFDLYITVGTRIVPEQ